MIFMILNVDSADVEVFRQLLPCGNSSIFRKYREWYTRMEYLRSVDAHFSESNASALVMSLRKEQSD